LYSLQAAVTMLWAAPPEAFQPLRNSGPAPAHLRETGVTRLRAVRTSAAFPAKPRLPLKMRMNFFPDTSIEVIWERAVKDPATGAIEWTGRVTGSRLENAAMIVNGRTITANVNPGRGKIYQVRTGPGDVLWIREFKPAALPADR
jgi:hypothetical protein